MSQSSTETQAELQRFRQDIDYYHGHHQELLQRYPNRWVAILDRQVVGVDPDPDHLLDELKARGIDPGRALIEHVSAEEDLLILHL